MALVAAVIDAATWIGSARCRPYATSMAVRWYHRGQQSPAYYGTPAPNMLFLPAIGAEHHGTSKTGAKVILFQSATA